MYDNTIPHGRRCNGIQYIAFDSHKRYTFASVEDHASGTILDKRIDHERGALREFLSACEPGSPVAVETIGTWYWIVDEIEAAGMNPQLVHARKAKMMMASSKKTDKLDAYGMDPRRRSELGPNVKTEFPTGLRNSSPR